MGHTKNLQSTEAIAKLKELAESAKTCMFATALFKAPVSSRPMSSQIVDEEGNIWFFSDVKSNKNSDIQSDNRVQLFFSNTSNSEYMDIYGTAEITQDKNKIEEYWTNWVKAWFPEGKDDPAISLIKVKPESGYYWDTKHGKMISLLKIAAAVVTGKIMDDGLEGELDV